MNLKQKKNVLVYGNRLSFDGTNVYNKVSLQNKWLDNTYLYYSSVLNCTEKTHCAFLGKITLNVFNYLKRVTKKRRQPFMKFESFTRTPTIRN